MGRWVPFFREVVNEFLTDNCPHLAASISYYVLLSLFPLTLALVSLLGFIAHSPEMQAKVVEGIGNFLAVSPESQDFLTNNIESVVNTRAVTGIIGIVGLVIGGNAVFTAVRKSLNTAWGIRRPRPFFTERLIEFGMMTGAALFLLLSLAVGSALGILRNLEITAFGTNAAFFWNAMSIMASVIITFTVFLFLYKFVPNTTVRWRDIWLGALLAAIGVEVTKGVFLWYTTNYGHYNLIYGSIGSIIGLLVWVYFSAVIFLFCAKLTAVHSRTPAPTAVLVDRLRATLVELKQRLAVEPLPKANRAVDELDKRLAPVVSELQHLTSTEPKGKGKRSLRALLKGLLLRKASEGHGDSTSSEAGATSSPPEQSPR